MNRSTRTAALLATLGFAAVAIPMIACGPAADADADSNEVTGSVATCPSEQGLTLSPMSSQWCPPPKDRPTPPKPAPEPPNWPSCATYANKTEAFVVTQQNGSWSHKGVDSKDANTLGGFYLGQTRTEAAQKARDWATAQAVTPTVVCIDVVAHVKVTSNTHSNSFEATGYTTYGVGLRVEPFSECASAGAGINCTD